VGEATLDAPENPMGAESPEAKVDLSREKQAKFQAIGEAPEAQDQEERRHNQEGRPDEAFVVVQGSFWHPVGAEELGQAVKGGVDQTEVDQRPQLNQGLYRLGIEFQQKEDA
jgi:hypothetical protein